MFTCPAKTFAIFAHNIDVDYKDSELLRLFDDCKTKDDVERLQRVYPELVPPNSKGFDEDLPSLGVETILFN